MIRKAELKDASRLAEILIFTKRVTYRDVFRDDMTSFGKMQVVPLARSFEENPSLLNDVFVWDDGIVKAMIRRGKLTGEKRELCELYVDPFFQGEGIGKALIRDFEENARKDRCGSIWLWALEQNETAIRFYEHLGFSASKTKQELPECPGFFVVKYEKKLSEK